MQNKRYTMSVINEKSATRGIYIILMIDVQIRQYYLEHRQFF